MTPTLSGTHINYLFICHRKLWLYAHHVEMEQASDRVMMGRQLHEESFKRKKKEVMIDDVICLDWLEHNIVHDTKLTRSMEQAHRAQILYYLWYLKKIKGMTGLSGTINYPKQRRRESVELTPEIEPQVEGWIAEAELIVQQKRPPAVEEPMTICRKCGYQDLCWG